MAEGTGLGLLLATAAAAGDEEAAAAEEEEEALVAAAAAEEAGVKLSGDKSAALAAVTTPFWARISTTADS